MRRALTLVAFGFALAFSGAGHAAENLVGAKWLVELVRGAGTIDTAQTDFSISADGQVSTGIGCNRMGGTVKIEGDRLTFSPLFGTKKMCAPVLMDVEQKYSAAIEATRSFRIDDGRLKFLDEKGAELVMFTRARD